MAYDYNYSQQPPYNTQFPNQSYQNPVHNPGTVFTSNPAPVYAPNQSPYNSPHVPSQSATQEQFLLQQQQEQEQFLLQQQQQQQQQQGFPNNNTQMRYEFDYQPKQTQNYTQQSQATDMFIGQMATNLTGGSLAATALQYGPSIAATGKEFFDQKMDTFQQSKSVYKSYWDVDTSYVLRKLFYLLFPINPTAMQSSGFTSFPTQEGSSRSLNCPDLYIPSMSLVTYILMVGYVLGTQGRFAPDLLGITATSALVWLTLELCCSLLAIYITGTYSNGLWHKLGVLSGYKFFYMVCCIGAFVVFGSVGYYVCFLATSLSSVLFSVQNLKAMMKEQIFSNNSWYLMVAISVLQPVLVYWLTWHLVHYTQ